MLSCGSKQAAQQQNAAVPEPQRRIATYIFGEAVKQYAQSNYDNAYTLLQQTLRVNPQHAPAFALLARYENYMRHPQAADSLIARALELDPTNPDYLEIDAFLLQRDDDLDGTIEAFERLAAVKPHSTKVLGALAQHYIRAHETDSALNTFSRIENIMGRNEQTSNMKHLLQLSKGDTAAAIGELQALCDEYPGDPNYAVLLANAYIRICDQYDSAQTIFNRVSAIDPQNPRLQLARLNMYERIDTEHFTALYDSLLYGPATNSDLRGALMMRFISEHQYDSLSRELTMAAFDSVLAQPQEDARMLSTYVAWLMTVKIEGDTLIDALNRVIEVEPDNEAALGELLVRYGTSDNSEGVTRICDQAITYYPHEAVYYYYGAVGNFMQGDTLTALERLTMACEHIDETTSITMAADIFTLQGDILHSLGRNEEAYAAYDSCLVYQPDNISCLNNYAYYLSLEGRDLERAEQMSYRTIKAEPDSRTYLDTYAWILFIEGRTDEAATYMDRIMQGIDTDCEEAPEDVSATVFEHAGDIYACQGDIEKALPFWQAAKRLGSDSKTLEKKIKRKKYLTE